MKKFVAAAVVCLLLTGCSASSEAIAEKACKDHIEAKLTADRIDYSEFNIGNMSDELFETSDTGKRDHSEDFMTGTGTIVTWRGTVEQKHTAICTVTVKDGEAHDVTTTISR